MTPVTPSSVPEPRWDALTREALRMIGDQDLSHWSDGHDTVTIAALRAALAERTQQEAQPEAWAVYWGIGDMHKNSVHFEKETAVKVASSIKSYTETRPLYSRPTSAANSTAPMQPSEALRLADAIDPLTRKGLDNLTCAAAAHMLRALAAPTQAAGGEAVAHRWDADGERCTVCGDKDWMGGPCSGAAPAAAVEPTCEICEGDPERCDVHDCGDAHRAAAAPEGLTSVDIMRAVMEAQESCPHSTGTTNWAYWIGTRVLALRPATPDAKTAEARKPLTDEQVLDEASHFGFLGDREQLVKFVRAIEREHGIGDQP